jgi:hypothetical protein
LRNAGRGPETHRGFSTVCQTPGPRTWPLLPAASGDARRKWPPRRGTGPQSASRSLGFRNARAR